MAVMLVLSMVSVPVAGADEPEHFLEYSEYNFAVNFVSGNLTATVTPSTIAPRDWPRIIFEHSTDILSPTFDVGMSTIYLFNDTNEDGMFARSEATHTAYLSSFYNVTWNATAVEFGNDTVAGEYAWLRADAVIGLYAHPEDEYPIIDRWANVSFWFYISQKTVPRSNLYGSYTVQGMVDVRVNFVLEILEPVNATGLAIEQRLGTGGSADLFLVREDTGLPTPQLTIVDSAKDETINGNNFTHPLRKTLLPCQEILFAKEDQTVQAHYRVSSEAYTSYDYGLSQVPMNLSYYTTGGELVLHTAYFPTDSNETLSHEIVVGIDESGFTPRFRDWLKDNLPMVMIVSGSIVAAVSILMLGLILRKHWGWGRRSPPAEPPKGQS